MPLLSQGGNAAVVACFLSSTESRIRMVNSIHSTLLGRQGDTAGSAAWLAALSGSALGFGQVLVGFLASEEFCTRSTAGAG